MEAWITLGKRKTTKQDKSLRLIWSLNLLAILIGNIMRTWSFTHITLSSDLLAILGTIIIVIGLLFRIWAIRKLGKFFEPVVVIKKDQPIIKTGPYKYIRHPAYAGGYLSFIGCGVALGNWIGLILIMILVFIGFYQRIKIEEKILLQGFGKEYQTYINTTKKLIPYIY
jgi:protein-S-isoprenylcysteine O-methyltransferase Ste14